MSANSHGNLFYGAIVPTAKLFKLRGDDDAFDLRDWLKAKRELIEVFVGHEDPIGGERSGVAIVQFSTDAWGDVRKIGTEDIRVPAAAEIEKLRNFLQEISEAEAEIGWYISSYYL